MGIKSSPTRAKNASFQTVADFHDYRTDDGYLYVTLRAQSSRVNKNHDGWPTAEMAGGPDAWEKISSQHRSSEGGFTIESSKDAEKGFSTFLGKPNFVDHHNSNPERARGVVVDSKFHVLDHKTAAEGDEYWGSENVDPEHMPPSEIELLVEIDADSFPVYAKAVVDGDIDGWSMGCDVDYSKCSHCGNEATNPDEYCSHIVSKGAEHDYLSSDGTKTARKSYENCYGINYFEISGVFDPADDTATSREVRSAVEKEAIGIPAPGMPNPMQDLFEPTHEEIMAEAARMQANGVNAALSLELASKKLRAEKGDAWGQARPNEGAPYEPQMKDYTAPPAELNMRAPINEPAYSSVKTAQPEEPQEMHTKAPDDIDTLRKERVCPLCGSDMEGDQCDVCGYEEPPEEFQNPDLHKNEDTEALEDAQQGEVQQEIPNENPVTPPEPSPESMATQTRNPQPTSSVISDMRWTPKTASAPKPTGDEPSETVKDDQTTPVTSYMRTARELIQAANNQENNNMADETKVAADAVADAKPDNRVDVTGVGGVAPGATNADASKPEGAHSWEPKGVTVDVTGKGGVLEDSNAEASEPSAGQVSNDATSDNAGYQKGGEKGPKTQTWDNSNEPGSAVSDKAFPTSSVEAAKEGVKPGGGADVQPQRRENVESEEGWDNPGTPTDQWTGTDGNGVTRQQNPVTNVPTKSQGIKASGFVSLAALRLADTEVALGLITEDQKYDRLAELEGVEDAEIVAEHRALAKVKTAGMTRTAAAGGVKRLPSFSRIASDEPVEAPPVSDDLLDNALFS